MFVSAPIPAFRSVTVACSHRSALAYIETRPEIPMALAHLILVQGFSAGLSTALCVVRLRLVPPTFNPNPFCMSHEVHESSGVSWPWKTALKHSV